MKTFGEKYRIAEMRKERRGGTYLGTHYSFFHPETGEIGFFYTSANGSMLMSLEKKLREERKVA